MRARVFGLMIALAWLILPLGRLTAGVALELFGVRATITALVGVLLALAALALAARAFHDIEAPLNAADHRD